MTDLGELNYFLGMEFTCTETGLILHQRKYVKELLERFNMFVCNPARSPIEVNLKLMNDKNETDSEETLFKQIVGSLRFLCNSRPYLSYSVGLISRFMRKPRRTHMLAAKRVLRYVKGPADFGILFPFGKRNADEGSLELIGFTDSDHGGDCVERKSTSGYMFMLNGSPISWCSKKQPVVALSSCEAEYIAGSYAAC
ncbi:secreted RxLR effector protein 161-like [Vigna angularis]|uniref:secreted RxLR effector protein 161-like n=1 Tax=Phaseolus angularis TaxID=3914 RepID=UPI00080A6743|nr:secreted RxLR effector protein 161-like [Vigna angularis]